ncbi:unnamed protein product [Moneuplotes crassus]|uniref:Uncharacterized protein n=1 Tax=Euplotes crassus TaxID=5936 RepID=A0AAD2D7C1_EUPCR|nr:unnamed protein product [Moneuplotes crassus]
MFTIILTSYFVGDSLEIKPNTNFNRQPTFNQEKSDTKHSNSNKVVSHNDAISSASEDSYCKNIKQRKSSGRNTRLSIHNSDGKDLLIMYNQDNQRYSTLDMRDKTLIILDKKHSINKKSFAPSPERSILRNKSLNKRKISLQKKQVSQLPKVDQARGSQTKNKKSAYKSRMQNFKKNIQKKNLDFRNIRKSLKFNKSVHHEEGVLSKTMYQTPSRKKKISLCKTNGKVQRIKNLASTNCTPKKKLFGTTGKKNPKNRDNFGLPNINEGSNLRAWFDLMFPFCVAHSFGGCNNCNHASRGCGSSLSTFGKKSNKKGFISEKGRAMENAEKIRVLESQIGHHMRTSSFPLNRNEVSQYEKDHSNMNKSIDPKEDEKLIQNCHQPRIPGLNYLRGTTAKFIDPCENSEPENNDTEKDSVEIKMNISEGLSPLPNKCENPRFKTYDSIKEQKFRVFPKNTFAPNNFPKVEIGKLNDIQKSKTTVKKDSPEKSPGFSDIKLRVTDEADNRTIENNYNLEEHLEQSKEEKETSTLKVSESFSSSSDFMSCGFTTTTGLNLTKKKILKSDTSEQEQNAPKASLRPQDTFNHRRDRISSLDVKRSERDKIEEEKDERSLFANKARHPDGINLAQGILNKPFAYLQNNFKDKDSNDSIEIKNTRETLLNKHNENEIKEQREGTSENTQKVEDIDSEETVTNEKLFAARKDEKRIKFRPEKCLSPRSYLIMKCVEARHDDELP